MQRSAELFPPRLNMSSHLHRTTITRDLEKSKGVQQTGATGRIQELDSDSRSLICYFGNDWWCIQARNTNTFTFAIKTPERSHSLRL